MRKKQTWIELLVLGWLFFYPPVACQADAGTTLVVTTKLANLREGPSTRHRVLLRLPQDRHLTEILREGNWVRVSTGDPGPTVGWIHASLVTTAPETDPAGAVFELFRRAMDEYERRAYQRTGKDYFSEIAYPGNLVIQITAAGAWLTAAREERNAVLEEVFDLWQAAVGNDLLGITVEILDPDGTRLVSKFR